MLHNYDIVNNILLKTLQKLLSWSKRVDNDHEYNEHDFCHTCHWNDKLKKAKNRKCDSCMWKRSSVLYVLSFT